VDVYTVVTQKAADQSNQDVTTLVGQALVSITSLQTTRGLNDQEVTVLSATLTGTDPILASPNAFFAFASGPLPLPVGTRMYPTNGISVHGNTFLDPFYRGQVSGIRQG
jgi:hypothetical protein